METFKRTDKTFESNVHRILEEVLDAFDTDNLSHIDVNKSIEGPCVIGHNAYEITTVKFVIKKKA
jgi:hypothetical protein